MAVDVSCPNCGEVYEDQDESILGTDVECECGHVFTATAPKPKAASGKARFKKKARRSTAQTPTESPSQPASQRSKSGGSISSAVWVILTVVIGGASAFGALYALGYLPPGKAKPKEVAEEKSGNPQQQQNSQQDTTVAMRDGKTRKPSTPVAQKTEQPKPIQPITVDPEPPKPVDPAPVDPKPEPPNPVDPNPVTPVDPVVVSPPTTPSSPANNRNYKLLEIQPFAPGNPITANLDTLVRDELSQMDKARHTLVKVLDSQIAPLAAAGKLSEIQTLRAAKTELLGTGETSTLSKIDSDDIKAAVKVYGESVASSQARLHEAYTSAITAARESGDSLLQVSLTRERDAGFDAGSQTWIVVFRSSNPARWNTAHEDGTNMSIPLAAVSSDIKTLRLRRMDTGATIVVSMQRQWLMEKHLDEVSKVGWESKNSDYWKSRRLGVFRADVELRDAPAGTVFVSSTSFGRGYDGWGFGHTNNRFNEPQGYSWGGQTLGPTVFEIAVSNVELVSVAPFALRGDGPSAPKAKPTAIPTDSPVAAQLDADKAVHKAAIEDARKKVFATMDEVLKELGAAGDVAGIEKLAAARKSFEEHDAIQNPSSKIRTKLVSFQSEIGRADLALEKAYTRAVAAFKREEDTDSAELLEELLAKGVGYEAERWMVLFRSPNPQLWNTTSRGQFQFARPITDASDGVKYLRMQVITKSTDRNKLKPVICEMTNSRLAGQSDVNGVGWNGTKRQDRNAGHLGIYLLDKVVPFPAPNSARGLVSIWSKGFDGHLGWGFGHHIKVDKVQGFAWAGQTSTQPLLIEIAVSTKPLREHEQKVLLVPGGIR